MTAMQKFDYQGRQLRAFADENGDPIIVAADLAAMLGYSSTKDMTRALEPDEKGGRLVPTPGGEQQMSVITEPGMYRAILQRQTGRMVDADQRAVIKAIQRWVTAEVLPAIRKTGSYSTVAHPVLPQDYASALRALASEVEERQRAEERAKQLEAPARSWDELASAKGDYSLRDAAQVLSRDHGITIGQNRLMDKIREWGLVDDRDRPYQQYVDRGLIRSRARTYEHPHTGERKAARPQLRITPKGLHEIRVRLARTNELALTI